MVKKCFDNKPITWNAELELTAKNDPLNKVYTKLLQGVSYYSIPHITNI